MTELPPEAAFMSLAAKERAGRAITSRQRQDENVTRIGPRALGPGDGLIEPTAWEGKPIPGRKWIVPGLIPCNTVTLLTGNGGDGKSLLALQLLKSSVTNTKWLGRDVKNVRCLGIWAEDEEEELMRRTNDALTAEQMSFGDLDGLTYIDRDGRDSIMYEAQHNDTTGRVTQFFEQVWETVQSLGAELVVLDSLYNFFGGNENVRSQANQFIGELKRMCRHLRCAVVLVAHPSRAGMGKDGDGTAGNTAWHNSVRSRLYLHRLKHASGDPDKKGPLVVEHMKANYGRKEDQIEIMWEEGRFIPVIDPTMSTPPRRGESLFGEQL